VFLNGHWVKVKKPVAPAAKPGAEPQPLVPSNLAAATTTAPLVTQRVIRIPTSRLTGGDARVNVIVRPGDIIRVPPIPTGFFYVGGQVTRGGVFQMSERITLTNAIIAAGGFALAAVPERVDLTRMVGHDHEATIRLNTRAIFEGTEPDVFLKANDRINVGTNFWSMPLAVLRSGFRATYGFGLIADRNFGTDIFGVPKGGSIFQ
jgi:protein involved in polysaccharide export with SLBB domain